MRVGVFFNKVCYNENSIGRGKLHAADRDKRLKRKDLILIGAVLLLAALAFVGYRLWGGGTAQKAEVIIYLNDKVYRRVPLEPQTIVDRSGRRQR